MTRQPGRQLHHVTILFSVFAALVLLISPDSHAGKRIGIFVDKCGKGKKLKGINLRKSCKKSRHRLLVKCVRKKGKWVKRKSMYCRSRRDRLKFKNCNSRQQRILLADVARARPILNRRISQLSRDLKRNRFKKRKLRRKMKAVLRKMKKIRKALNSPRKYVCKKKKGLCKKAVMHTLPAGRVVRVCPSHYKQSDLYRAGTVVHEIAHYKNQATDRGEYNDCSKKPKLKEPFHLRADYYHHLITCGYYIPK